MTGSFSAYARQLSSSGASVASYGKDILKNGVSALGICVLKIPRLQRLRRLNK
jgi:hypothetical protein